MFQSPFRIGCFMRPLYKFLLVSIEFDVRVYVFFFSVAYNARGTKKKGESWWDRNTSGIKRFDSLQWGIFFFYEL